LGLSQEVSDFITNIQTCSDRLNHLFLGEQSHTLSITFELLGANKFISQNGMGAKLNDHGVTFESQLHRVSCVDELIIGQKGVSAPPRVPLRQLAHGRWCSDESEKRIDASRSQSHSQCDCAGDQRP